MLFNTMISQKMNALQNYSYRDTDYQKFEDTAIEVKDLRERMSKITDKLPSIDSIDKLRRWSDEMPERTWEQARDECRKIGKRLPSLSELQAAHKAGLGEIWGGTYLWTSTYYDYDGYFFMPMSDGDYNWNGKDGTIAFRCIR